MGKKSKKPSAAASQWQKIETDFNGERSLPKDDPMFQEVNADDLKKQILDPILQSGENFGDVLAKLIQWKEYFRERCENLFTVFDSHIRTEFKRLRITLERPFDESKWQELETLETDLNKLPIYINGIKTSTATINPSLDILMKDLGVIVKSAQIFPFDEDSFGLPPINCKKIWNPLIWMRIEIEKKIKQNTEHDLPPLNQLVTSLNLAPKEGHFEKLAVTAFFLEKTADNLDYSNSENKDQFIKDLQSKFGTTKVNELTMVLPDILMAYSEELMERVMQVSYFIPFELFRLMFLCWQPKTLKLRLRSEACSSLDDAARIEWDDEEVFTSTTLFNCPLFDRCEPVCLGDEPDIRSCKMIVEATGSRLFNPVYNEKNFDTAGRDFLTIFPMETILLKRTVTLKSGASVKTQLKQQIEYIANTFFCNAEEHKNRAIHFELKFENAGEVQMSLVRKCIPQTANKRKICSNFNVEQDTKDLFNEFGNSSEGKHLFVTLFDPDNQVIIDLKILLD